MSKLRKKKRQLKRVLALPDLEQSKAAVLNSLTSKSGQQTYDRAITDFVEWYCSEPRLAFNRTVVLRYRIYLEQKPYALATINLRLAVVRRVAYAAADSQLLSPELAAGIRKPPPSLHPRSLNLIATGRDTNHFQDRNIRGISTVIDPGRVSVFDGAKLCRHGPWRAGSGP